MGVVGFGEAQCFCIEASCHIMGHSLGVIHLVLPERPRTTENSIKTRRVQYHVEKRFAHHVESTINELGQRWLRVLQLYWEVQKFYIDSIAT